MGFVLRPPSHLQIHCWGGLGSQMYAWALYELLEIRFPNRKLKLIFHTGGVTKRLPDLEPLFTAEQKGFVQDYLSKEATNEFATVARESASGIKNALVKIGKRALLATGFVATVNNEVEFSKIKPWVVSIRGHYSELKIDPSTIKLMQDRAGNSNSLLQFDFQQKPNLDVLHYRLGDLMELAEKAPNSTKSITAAITKAGLGVARELWVLSDSPQVAIDLLHKENPQLRLKLDDGDLNAWQSLMAMTNASTLVGTSSKLSIWAMIFRAYFSETAPTYIPAQVQHHARANLGEKELLKVRFY